MSTPKKFDPFIVIGRIRIIMVARGYSKKQKIALVLSMIDEFEKRPKDTFPSSFDSTKP